jgi:glucose repression mediator protein
MKFEAAKGAYRRVLERDPNHAKVLQQLGWLHHQQSTNYASQEQAIEYLEKSVASGKPSYSMIMCVELITCSDQTDAQSWYLLGRCYMSQQKYPKAYEAYQQAVYRDGRNPTFWCSIGVLYYQINQYRDALDAYSRAIRLNPNISEVWYDLGTLVSTCRSLTTSASLTMSQYESCNNQTADALDAYQRAADLDPSNVHIKARLQLLQNGQSSAGGPNQGNAPIPQDVHPQAYQPANVHGPAAPQWGAPQSSQPPQGPVPPALAPGWDRPLAQIRDPGLPPQQLNPYEQRDGIRPPTQHVPQRPVSPRQEPSRSYAEPSRPPTNGPGPQGPAGPPPPGPGPMRRGMSPSPKTHHVAPSPYHPQAPHLTPQPAQAQIPPTLHQQQQLAQPTRISNPNYGPHAGSVPPPPPPPPTGLGGPASQVSSQGAMLPYGRPASPPPEVRPIVENRPGSPRNGYQGPYQHHPDPSANSGIANGAPPPASALAAAEQAARDRDDRPPTAPPKRHREWEDSDHLNQKPPTNDEKRQKMEESHTRRPTPPHRMSSPQVPRHSPQDGPDPRRFNDGYHPSEAAHHPPSLPAMAAARPLSRMSETSKPERPEHHEPAARHMDVDENYDDEGDDAKPAASKSDRGSPRNVPINGAAHAPTPVEQKP